MEVVATGEVLVVFVTVKPQTGTVLVLRVGRMTEMDDRTVRECSLILLSRLRRLRKDDTALLDSRHLFYRRKKNAPLLC